MPWQLWTALAVEGSAEVNTADLTAADIARFRGLIDDSAGPDACWPWRGYDFSRNGYGRFQVRRGGRRFRLMAHRTSYELAYGVIPDTLTIDHVKARGCVRRDCANPGHLEPVTMRTNLLRGANLAAVNARKSHCIHGHPFDLFNTRWTANRWRQCMECERLRIQKRARATGAKP